MFYFYELCHHVVVHVNNKWSNIFLTIFYSFGEEYSIQGILGEENMGKNGKIMTCLESTILILKKKTQYCKKLYKILNRI